MKYKTRDQLEDKLEEVEQFIKNKLIKYGDKMQGKYSHLCITERCEELEEVLKILKEER
jgi:hypothetical protein